MNSFNRTLSIRPHRSGPAIQENIDYENDGMNINDSGLDIGLKMCADIVQKLNHNNKGQLMIDHKDDISCDFSFVLD